MSATQKDRLRWLKRVLWGLLGLLALLILLLAGAIAFDGWFGRSSTELTNVSFPAADGGTLYGYLALPDGPGPHPAVLLIHEWWGLNEGILVLADALAAEGYVVLAADAYRGNLTSQIPRAIWLRLTTPEEQIRADLDDALDHLLAQDEVDPARVATMGFCFGGGESLQLGLRQPERLAVTILYYGSVVTDIEALRPLRDQQGVLGIFGEEDQQIFVEDVLEFEAALNSLEISHEVTIYEGVGHAFLNEDNFDEPGTAGDAWQQTLEFLATNLQVE
jgi:carboxymethylenebutenolidase